MKITVPYDSRTGHVYLNSIGANEEQASGPVFDGSLGIDPNDFDYIGYTEGEIEFEFDLNDAISFPVFVPFSKEDGEPVLECIGSSPKETLVNLSYANYDEHGFMVEEGRLKLPVLGYQPVLPAP